MNLGDNQEPVLFKGDSSASNGSVTVRRFSTSKRSVRVIASLLIGLGVTALSALIPILHFFLVPLGLIFTLILVSWVSAQKAMILEGHGECPYCGKPFRLLKRPYKFPIHDMCEECRRQVVITTT